MLESLFPYQKDGAEWLAPKAQALLADDMGLGKSAQTVYACDIVGAENILVLCPAIARVNWEREFRKFSYFDRPSSVIFTGKDAVPLSGVVICSYDLALTLAPRLKQGSWDVLVLDEAHFLKERSAKRTRLVYGHGSRQPGLDKRAKRVWRLTGTPAPNNASELFTHLKSAGIWSDPYWDFVFRYCDGFNHDFGFKITGVKNAGELKQLLEPFMLRRLKEDVLKDLPPIRYQTVAIEESAVELDPWFYDYWRLIGKEAFLQELQQSEALLKKSMEVVTEDGMPSLRARLGVLEAMASSMSTLRRYIGMAKMPRCCDLLAEELESGELDKVVIFAVHRDVIENTRQRLRKYGAVTLYGGTPPQTRQANIDKFQADPKCRVFIGQVDAAGTNITLTASCEVVFFEQAWVPAANAQATMRCHRIGQTRPVRVRVFELHGSVDVQVQETLVRKARELTKIFSS